MKISHEFRDHWRTLAGCTIAAAIGTIGLHAYTSGAFVHELTEIGFTRDQLARATLVLSASIAVCAPIAGALMDRFGAFRVVAVSIFGEALAFSLLSIIPADYSVYVACIALLALLGVGTTPPGFARMVTARFDRRRGLALGIMISGLGLMAITGPIWATWVIGHLGWRGCYRVMAGLVLVLGGAGMLLIRGDHGGSGQVQVGSKAAGGDFSAFRRPLFWVMLLGFLAPAFFSGGYLLHLISLLRERGFTPAGAAQVQSLIGVAVLTGRLTSGLALDRFAAPRVAAFAFAISGLSCALLIQSNTALMAVAAFGIGLTIGAELDIMAYCISRYFGLANFGKLYGLAYGSLVLSAGASPVMISRIADTGGYPTALMVSTFGTLVGALILLMMPDPRRYAEKAPEAKPLTDVKALAEQTR
jgi:MFS family permease